MANFRFVHDKAGYFEVMGSQAMRNILQNCAQCVANAADASIKSYSAEHHHKCKQGTMRDGRPAAFVYTYSNAAKKAQNQSKTLEHAMAAAKGGVM